MADDSHDKSHDPTPHRRQEARDKGQVARSQDLGSAVMLLFAAMLLWWMGSGLVDFFGSLAHENLSTLPSMEFGLTDTTELITRITRSLAATMLPILGLLMLIGIGINLLQVGILFLPDKLMPDLERLDPIKGFGRVFSLAGLVRLGFGILKVIVVCAVAYVSLVGQWREILNLSEAEPGNVAVVLLSTLFWTTVKIALALLVLAILDFAFQKWKQEQDLRMTTQEVREEMKNLQGDPQVAARRRQVQRQLVLNRMNTAVPKADVVVTNPTELAIAIQYDFENMAAPVVVAKGAGTVAQRIRRLALEHGIPIIERKPLAQALYKEVDIGKPIPHQWYSAVADVLAYVYQLKGKKLPGYATRRAG